MREEFIGHLSEFEPLCPSLFQHRFRLEKMGRANVRTVIQQMLESEAELGRREREELVRMRRRNWKSDGRKRQNA